MNPPTYTLTYHTRLSSKALVKITARYTPEHPGPEGGIEGEEAFIISIVLEEASDGEICREEIKRRLWEQWPEEMERLRGEAVEECRHLLLLER